MIIETQEVLTRIATVQMGADGIVRQTFMAGAEETHADAQENIQAAMRVSGGRRSPVLVDLRGIKAQAREARVFYSGPEAVAVSNAVALLVESRVSMLIANFFISITASNSRRPTKLFTDASQAVQWLSEFVG